MTEGFSWLKNGLSGWARLVVGGVDLPVRPVLHVAAGATAEDNVEDDCTDVTFVGTLENIGAGVLEVFTTTARSTLEFVGFTAVENTATDTLTLTPADPPPEYVHASGDLTYYHDATLAELTIPDTAGCYLVHAYYTMADHTTPTDCAYYEAIFCFKRAANGTLSAASIGGLGAIPESGARYGNFNLVNIIPYAVVGTNAVTFKANAGGLVPATVYDVACDVRIMTFPGGA